MSRLGEPGNKKFRFKKKRIQRILVVIGLWIILAGLIRSRWTVILHRLNLADPAPVHVVPGSRVRDLEDMAMRLAPMIRPMTRPGPNDWLAHHPEPGQNFLEYVFSAPMVPTRNRRLLRVKPIGPFIGRRQEILDATAEILKLFFALPVTVDSSMRTSDIPRWRKRYSGKARQLHAGYLCTHVLAPAVEEDTVSCIGLTSMDLWPGGNWNYVFGLANLKLRTGVWSIHRFGEPDISDAWFATCLLRSAKTATHETGHMIGLLHCIAFDCAMNGSNHIGELDSQPLHLCPQCLIKICWATDADPGARYTDLAAWCRTYGFSDQAEFYLKSADLVRLTR